MKKNIFFIAILGIASLGLRGMDESNDENNKETNFQRCFKFFKEEILTTKGQDYMKTEQFAKDVKEKNGALFRNTLIETKVSSEELDEKDVNQKKIIEERIRSLKNNETFDDKTKVLTQTLHSSLTDAQKVALAASGLIVIAGVTYVYRNEVKEAASDAIGWTGKLVRRIVNPLCCALGKIFPPVE